MKSYIFRIIRPFSYNGFVAFFLVRIVYYLTKFCLSQATILEFLVCFVSSQNDRRLLLLFFSGLTLSLHKK